MSEDKQKNVKYSIKDLIGLSKQNLKSLNLIKILNINKLISKENQKFSKSLENSINIEKDNFANNYEIDMNNEINFEKSDRNEDFFSDHQKKLINQNLILKEETETLRKNIYELNQKNQNLFNDLENKNIQIETLKESMEHRVTLAEEKSQMHFDQIIELKSNIEILNIQKNNYEELSNAFEYQLNKCMSLINKLFRIKKIRHTRIDYKSIELESLLDKE